MAKSLLALALGARLTGGQLLHMVDWLKVLCDQEPFSIDLKPATGTVVPVFYRSVDYIEVEYQVTDQVGAVVIARTSVTLMRPTRRLAEAFAGIMRPSSWWANAPSNDGEAASTSPQLADANSPATPDHCEEYFLLDGRHPVDLPDTWAEARTAFEDICRGESEMPDDCPARTAAIFEGRPHAAETFSTDVAFCEVLARGAKSSLGGFFAEAQPRRTKGSTGAGSGYYSGGSSGVGTKFTGTSYASSYGGGTRVGYYGMGTHYPYGYSSRPYGYSGYRNRAAVPTAMYFVMRPNYGYSTYYLGPGRGITQPANRMGTEVCDDDMECQISVKDLIRDDLMDKNFATNLYTAPLLLTVYTIKGGPGDQAFDRVAMCPPPGWTDGGSWTPPPTNPQLFFALGVVDTMQWWEDDLGSLIGGLVGGLLGCCCCCCLCRYMRKKSKRPHAEECAEAVGFGGTLLHEGDQVKTQLTVAEGGNDSWFAGTIAKCYVDGQVLIQYDDGDEWCGNAGEVHLLNPPEGGAQGEAAHEHPLEEVQIETAAAWMCNRCSALVNVSPANRQTHYRCAKGCDYDLCFACHEATKAQVNGIIQATVIGAGPM